MRLIIGGQGFGLRGNERVSRTTGSVRREWAAKSVVRCLVATKATLRRVIVHPRRLGPPVGGRGLRSTPHHGPSITTLIRVEQTHDAPRT